MGAYQDGALALSSPEGTRGTDHGEEGSADGSLAAEPTVSNKDHLQANPGPKGRLQWLDPVGQGPPFHRLSWGATHGSPSMAEGHLGGRGAGRAGAERLPVGLCTPP